MESYIKITQFLLSLSLLIVLHEMGHFLPAKLFKTRVEKFYLFFDYKFSLFKKKIGDTVYGIGWIPLGGYVKISGMIDESMDKEQMMQPPQPWEFRSKPAWQRLIIMLGGVTVNFILGIFIYIMMFNVWGTDYVGVDDVKYGFSMTEDFRELGFQHGDKILTIDGEEPEDVMDVNKYLFLRGVSEIKVEHTDGITESLLIPEDIGYKIWQSGNIDPFTPRVPAKLDSITPDSPAEKAGLQSGDKVIKVDGEPIAFWVELTERVKNNTERKPMEIGIEREGRELTYAIAPNEDNNLGVYVFTDIDEILTINHKDFTFAESISPGFSRAYWTLKDYMGQFKYVFTKKGASSLGGFITIGSIFPSAWNWEAFWSITALLSIMLAFMNLLPIPALDGGHVVFTLYEMITGHKPSDKFLEYAQITGFIILVSLLLLANGNDIYKWLTGQL